MKLRNTLGLAAFLPLCLTAAVQADEAAAPSQGLPLKQVSLFSSGVGYFGRAGKVDGDGQVELYFRRDDLNDVLKSLVISDPSGELRPASFTLDELLSRRPTTTELPLPEAESLGGILRKFQGALIEIQIGAKTIRGRLVGVSMKATKDKNGDVTTVETANILTDDGLVAFRLDGLDDGGVVRLLDPALNSKLRSQLETRALQLTALADAGFRPIKLKFAGRGEREVKAGYIQATSVWKTSYRLVFDSKKNPDAKTDKKRDKDKEKENKADTVGPLLQGWAVVENTTDEDWKDVQLSLIAGRPVSFVMNLASPLYVQRPEVPLPFSGAPAPTVYKETMEAMSADTLDAPAAKKLTPGMSARAGGLFRNEGGFAGNKDRDDMAASVSEMMKQEAQANATERGDLFEYAIRQPVTLARGEAALVPIVSEGISGEKLSILDVADPTLRAVYGMRIKNTTGMHLAGGPITIYQDGLYAGDAQVTNIAPGESRLISYALDLDLVVGHESPAFAEETVGLVAKNGVLTITRNQRKTDVFTFRNKSDEDKKTLVQLPIDPNFKLVAPEKPTEQSPTEYRFEVPVPKNDNAKLTVVGEHVISDAIALVSSDINTILLYTKWGKISPALKTALEGVVTRRRKVIELQGRRASLEQQVRDITQEQDRIRSNMNSLTQNSDLYKRYVTKLDAQETQIEKLRDEIARLRDLEVDASKELQTYVDTLNVPA